MIRVTVLYAREKGKTFDIDYYITKHMPLVRRKLDPYGLKKAQVDKSVGKSDDGLSPYFAITSLYFDSVADFKKGFSAATPDLLKDLPNYTDVAPVVQLSEVVEC